MYRDAKREQALRRLQQTVRARIDADVAKLAQEPGKVQPPKKEFRTEEYFLNLGVDAVNTTVRAAANAELGPAGQKLADAFESTTKAAADILTRSARNKAVTFAFHGNYGGPNYSGGQYVDARAPLPPDLIAVAPTDPLDSAFRLHDIRYAQAATYQEPERRKQALREADRKLLKALDVLTDGGQLSWGQQAKAVAAKTLFRGKMAIGYDDPGSLWVYDTEAWRLYYALELGELEQVESELLALTDAEPAEQRVTVQLQQNDTANEYGEVVTEPANDESGKIEDNLPSDAEIDGMTIEEARIELAQITALIDALNFGDDIELEEY